MKHDFESGFGKIFEHILIEEPTQILNLESHSPAVVFWSEKTVSTLQLRIASSLTADAGRATLSAPEHSQSKPSSEAPDSGFSMQTKAQDLKFGYIDSLKASRNGTVPVIAGLIFHKTVAPSYIQTAPRTKQTA